MSTVISFTLKGIRQSSDNYGLVRLSCRGNCLCDQNLIRFFINGIIALCIDDIFVSLQRIQQAFHFKAVDMRTAAALIARRCSEFSDSSYFFR